MIKNVQAMYINKQRILTLFTLNVNKCLQEMLIKPKNDIGKRQQC